jgi:hypothetical protein
VNFLLPSKSMLKDLQLCISYLLCAALVHFLSRIVADAQVQEEPHGLRSRKVFESQLAVVKLLAVRL